MSTLTRFAIISVLLVTAGCTTKKTPIPEMTGPSEMSLSLRLQLSPDSILGDGGSQSVLTIEAIGPDGRPVRGLPLQIEQAADGLIFDFGTLSAKTVITGDDGRARVIFTSPRVNQTSVVTFIVTPIGGDFRGQIERTIDLRLVPVGVIIPPNSAPIPRFTVTPAAPFAFQTVSFDASDTRDPDPRVPSADPPLCGTACTYQWDFGDGGTATGIFATHEFTRSGNFLVRLTVTDAQGLSATTARSINVAATTAPTASFTFSPDDPFVLQTVFFNASTSTAASGRRIVSYEWEFGDGGRATGVTTSHVYQREGSYTITLVVTDDTGTSDATTQEIDVFAGGPGTVTASLSVTPSTGTTATVFTFDASQSRGSGGGSANIIEYRFNFGDGTPEVIQGAGSPTTTHQYARPGTYQARVSVQDNTGRTAVATRTVTVQ